MSTLTVSNYYSIVSSVYLYRAKKELKMSGTFLQPSERKQLFLTNHAINSTSGVTRRFNLPTKHGPVIKPDSSHDQVAIQSRSAPQWNSEQNIWEWWYTARYSGGVKVGGLSCYATSLDGLNWETPSLDLYEFNGSLENNIAGDPETRRLYHIIRDEKETDSQRRYKGLFDTKDRWLGVSPDGFDWKMLDVSPIPSQDESHFIYDEYTRQYLAFVKQPTKWGRSVYLSTSTDFDRFSFPKLVFNTDEIDNQNRINRIQQAINDPDYLSPPVVANNNYSVAQCYQMAVMPYEGIYIGFPVIYNPAGPDGLGNDTGLNQVELTVSEDLYHWDRVCNREIFIGIEPWDGINYGTAQIALCGRPIIRGNEIWIYYNALRIRDNEELYWEQDRYGFIDTRLFSNYSALHLAKLRLDGFVSLDATGEGEMITESFEWEGQPIHVNVDARGELRAALLNANTMEAVNGYTASEHAPITGDHTSIPLVWRGGSQGAQTVRIKFTLRDCKLYSFWME